MTENLRARGHEVTEVSKQRFEDLNEYKKYDFLLDIDCGRDMKGDYLFHVHDGPVPIPSVAYLIDSHGWPDLHQRVSRHADHVFFAVWDRRDLFSDHASAHWAPNFTDPKWFDRQIYSNPIQHDFGFFGSKGGLRRAERLVAISQAQGWTCDVREVGKKGKPRWPRTAEAMAACRVLFNHGQKHDDPNLRVMESMAMGRVLITPNDPRSGMGFLFEPWQHYLPYEPYTFEGLEERMVFAITRPDACAKIADQAYHEVMTNHTTANRIDKILEVIRGRG